MGVTSNLSTPKWTERMRPGDIVVVPTVHVRVYVHEGACRGLFVHAGGRLCMQGAHAHTRSATCVELNHAVHASRRGHARARNTLLAWVTSSSPPCKSHGAQSCYCRALHWSRDEACEVKCKLGMGGNLNTRCGGSTMRNAAVALVTTALRGN